VAVEIERKFLVKNELWREHVISSSKIRQSYLSCRANAAVRVRIADHKAYLTIKGATVGISRSEFEYEIPLADAELMLDLRHGGSVIEKTRYRVRCGDHIWDLDIFYGDNSGLQMAEVELGSESEEFQIPEWAAEEVTADNRYSNSSLATHPFSSW
jgi:adenylate cyclase